MSRLLPSWLGALLVVGSLLSSISVRQQAWVPEAIAQIPEGDWQPLPDYPEDGEAQIAQTMVARQRLVVRRTRLVGQQAELWPDWRHFGFLTNRTERLEIVEAEHRQPPSSSSRSATSKSRNSRTFPPASSTPTAPGR